MIKRENIRKGLGLMLAVRMLAGTGLAFSNGDNRYNSQSTTEVEETIDIESSEEGLFVVPKEIVNEKTKKKMLELPKGYTLYQVDGEKLKLLMSLDNGDSTIFMPDSSNTFEEKGFVGVRNDLYSIIHVCDLLRDSSQKTNKSGKSVTFYYADFDQTYSIAGSNDSGTLAIEPNVKKSNDQIRLILPKGWSIIYAGSTFDSPMDLKKLNVNRSTLDYNGQESYSIYESYLVEGANLETLDCSKFVGVPDELAEIVFAVDNLKRTMSDFYKNGGKVDSAITVEPKLMSDGKNGEVVAFPKDYVPYTTAGKFVYDNYIESVDAVNYFGCKDIPEDLIGLNKNIETILRKAKKLEDRIKSKDYAISEPVSFSTQNSGFIIHVGYEPYYIGDDVSTAEFTGDVPKTFNGRPNLLLYNLSDISEEDQENFVEVPKGYVELMDGASSLKNSFQKELEETKRITFGL